MKYFKMLLAPILIGLGVAANLIVGKPLGPFFFSFGLLAVCATDSLLFTGRVGFQWRTLQGWSELINILFYNFLFAIIMGDFIAIAYPSCAEAAIEITATWSISIASYLQAMFCGIIMYIAVLMYKQGDKLGILIGVPLFVFCGFQHSIANAIIYSMLNKIALPNLFYVFWCAFGNATGSILADIYNTADKEIDK